MRFVGPPGEVSGAGRLRRQAAKNFGEHNAVMAGLPRAVGDYVVIMDDDLQNSPEEIIRSIMHARTMVASSIPVILGGATIGSGTPTQLPAGNTR
jgi:glycosyltransferase involved in cell wall biosynthesis